MDQLESRLREWDGKTRSHLVSIYDEFRHDEFFLSSLTTLSKEETVQTAATWLIKHCIEETKVVKPALEAEVIELWQYLVKAESILHYLQILPKLQLTASTAEKLYPWLNEKTKHKNIFVRAWAYNGLHLAAMAQPKFADKTAELLTAALSREPASVRARIRACLNRK